MPPATGNEPFLDLARRRWSCRAYDAARPVPDALLRRCLEAARLAPSACNRQPWRFVVVRDPVQREAICRDGLLPGISHGWLRAAPVIVVLCAQLEIVTHRLAPLVSGVPYYLLDVGIAGEHFVLAAAEAGLGTCWIGWFNERPIRRLLRVPRGVRVACLIALGYPQSPERPAEARRHDLADLAYGDAWGTPLGPAAD